jgi:hypothetical protein
MPISLDTDRVNDRLGTVDGDRGMGSLVRVDPDDEHVVLPVLLVGFAAAGTPDTCQCRSSYEPHRDRIWPDDRFAQKPTSRRQGIHETHPARPPTLGNTAPSLPNTLHQGIRSRQRKSRRSQRDAPESPCGASTGAGQSAPGQQCCAGRYLAAYHVAGHDGEQRGRVEVLHQRTHHGWAGRFEDPSTTPCTPSYRPVPFGSRFRPHGRGPAGTGGRSRWATVLGSQPSRDGAAG